MSRGYTFQYRGSAPVASGQNGPTAGARFKPLFRMGYNHTFYDSDHGRCPDLQASPSPDCQSLLASFGMVFKAQATGFSVYFDEDRTADLVNSLKRRGMTGYGSDAGYWTRLTFVLQVANASFVDITDLPITTNPNERNLYANNSQAHAAVQGRSSGGDGAVARFCQGRYLAASDLFPVVGSEVTLTVPADAIQVDVTDISGAVVLSQSMPPSPSPAPQVVVLDLGTLPLGRYGITVVSDGGGSTPDTATSLVVYTNGTPSPLCLLDVFLTQPQPGMDGVYPVPSLWDNTPITADDVGAIDYILPFDARATQWRYYIVSQARGSHLTDLAIAGHGATFTRQPAPILLPSGSPAVLFTSDDPIKLRRIPPQRFRLTGQRQAPNGADQDIRVDCLPAAPPNPVWPGDTPQGGVSEMYVYV
ncbi:hypothetical protein [Nitrospirillum iridis]|uniref:Uncharacterized protein n=1 Tax=Nitrospirillum iridis TaxID=765888 RepID=A0A7X0EC46_9PROT|nr:hypothetical protein [Nitrospirillum iridis]MBB6250770.1 hypothetical protein [Nitrospirillum iridis]